MPEKAFTSDDWPTLLAPALAYVAVELDVHVGRVAYAYLRQSQHFVVPGKQHEDVVKNFFAPLIDGNRTFDPNAVWQHADFGGVLGHIWPSVVAALPKAVEDARSAKAGRTRRLCKTERDICDFVEEIVFRLSSWHLAESGVTNHELEIHPSRTFRERLERLK